MLRAVDLDPALHVLLQIGSYCDPYIRERSVRANRQRTISGACEDKNT
jgi:hypothetical protein